MQITHATRRLAELAARSVIHSSGRLSTGAAGLVLAALVGLMPAPSQAAIDLTGTTVRGSLDWGGGGNWFYVNCPPPEFVPDCQGGDTRIVGNGGEFSTVTTGLHNAGMSADLDTSTVEVSFVSQVFLYPGFESWDPLTFTFQDSGFIGSRASLLSFAVFDSADGFTYSLVGDTLTIYVPKWTSTGFDRPYDIKLQLAAVPEPSTYLLILAGLLMLGFTARHRAQGQTIHATSFTFRR